MNNSSAKGSNSVFLMTAGIVAAALLIAAGGGYVFLNSHKSVTLATQTKLEQGYEGQPLPPAFQLESKQWMGAGSGFWSYSYQTQLSGPVAVQQLTNSFTGHGYQAPAQPDQSGVNRAQITRDNILFDGHLEINISSNPPQAFATGPVDVVVKVSTLGK